MTPEKRKIQRRIEDDMVEIILKRIDDMEKRQEERDKTIHARIDNLVDSIHRVDITANESKTIGCKAEKEIESHEEKHTKLNVGIILALITTTLTAIYTLVIAFA